MGSCRKGENRLVQTCSLQDRAVGPVSAVAVERVFETVNVMVSRIIAPSSLPAVDKFQVQTRIARLVPSIFAIVQDGKAIIIALVGDVGPLLCNMIVAIGSMLMFGRRMVPIPRS